MRKFLSQSFIALTLLLGFAPAVKPITLSQSQERLGLKQIAQINITDSEKLATANRLVRLDFYNQALLISRAIGDRNRELSILDKIASLNYDLKNYAKALENIDRAIEIVEQISNNITSDELKASYSATVEKYYQLKTQILTESKQ